MNRTVRTSLARVLNQARCRSQPRAVRMSGPSHLVDARFRQSLYGRNKFDESKHPRAPAGRRNGGQFIEAGGGESPIREFFVPPSLRPYAAVHRVMYDNVPSETTAELQQDLDARTRELLMATTPEDRAYAKLWTDRLQQELRRRNYSDEHAPLAAKERLWKAQREFSQLISQRRALEAWLENSKRTIWKSHASVADAQNRLAAVKRSMHRLAAVTGAKIPQDSPVRNWSFEQKLAAAAEMALKSDNLAPEIAAQLKAAIEPANLARTVAVMMGVTAAHAYPLAGLAADTVLLGIAGRDGALTAHRLYLEVSSIQDEADLRSAAGVLEKELSSAAAGKLIELLTWGAVRGASHFHKNYKVSIDHDKVRRLATGEMPLTPSPGNIPIKIQRRTNAPAKKQPGTGNSAKQTPKPELPKAVIRNNAQQRRMLKRQQKDLTDAIDQAPKDQISKVRGRILHRQGVHHQDLSDNTLLQIPSSKLLQNQKIGKGVGREIDHIVECGDKRVYIESKLTIRSLNQRTINQLTNALRMAKSGDVVILNLARRATARELNALKKRLGPRRFKRIQVVHKQSDLFNLVKSTFEKELQ